MKRRIGSVIWTLALVLTLLPAAAISVRAAEISGAISSDATWNGGSITGNTSTGTDGAGVYVYNGTFTMNGGSISGNRATNYANGGGVYVRDNSTFIMNGGTITGNQAGTTSGSGGGVYINAAKFYMNGGSINGNSASSGGGVYLYTDNNSTKAATFTMNAGAICNNKGTGGSGGGGVDRYTPGSKYSTFTMNGGWIGGNTGGFTNDTPTTGDGISLKGGIVGTIFTNATKSSVTVDGCETGTTTCTVQNIKTSNDLQIGSRDANTIVNIYSTDKSADNVANNVADVSGYTTHLYKCTLNGTLTVNGNMSLYGSKVAGATTVSANGSLSLYAGASTTHYYNETAGKGADAYTASSTGGPIVSRLGAVLGSATNQPQRTTVNGGALAVYDGTLHGGVTLTNSGSKLTLYGRTNDDGTVNYSVGALVTGCKGEGTVGSGVRLADDNGNGNTLAMYGGAIVGNKGSETNGGGGGVTVYHGSFVLYGGSISKNTTTAPGSGGGISVSVSGSFTMLGGTISGNTAPNGGGVDVGSKFTMTDGEIKDNTASSGHGGGVRVVESGTFAMSGGSITGNKAPAGGGVFVDSGAIFKLSGAVAISGNTLYSDSTAANNVGVVKLTGNYALYSSAVTIDGVLNPTAPIGVTVYGYDEEEALVPAATYPVVFTSGWSAKMGDATIASYFVSDSSSYTVALDEESGELQLDEPTTHKVTYNYNANGGSSATATTATVAEGSTIDLTPTATKDGWTFVGWNTTSTATTALDSLTMDVSDVTLYAIFSKTLKATFYTRDATDNHTTSQVVTKTVYKDADVAGATVTAPTPSVNVSYEGKTCEPKCWLASNGTTEHSFESAVSATAEGAEYFAHYESTQEITVTYFVPTGVTQPPSQSARFILDAAKNGSSWYPPAFTLAAAPDYTDSSKVFDKWHKGSEDGTKLVAGRGYNFSENTTLYAGWADSYDLWVGGVLVTSANYTNIRLAIQDRITANHLSETETVSGNASYTRDTKTLRLDGFSYSGLGYHYDERACDYAIFSLDDELTILLNDSNSLTMNNSTNNTAGISVDKAGSELIFRGSGSLDVTIHNATPPSGTYSHGIEAQNLSFTAYDTPQVSATAGQVTGSYGSYPSSVGIYVASPVSISGGTLTGIGRDAGANGYSYGIHAVQGLTVGGTAAVVAKSTDSGVYTGYGIYCSSGALTVNRGTLTAQGKSQSIKASGGLSLGAGVTAEAGAAYDGSDKAAYTGGALSDYKYFAATHSALTTYTVTFNANGGSTVASKTVTSGGKVTKPADPTRSGYTFRAWQLSGTDYDFTTLVTDDITLVADWTADPTPTLTPTPTPTPSPVTYDDDDYEEPEPTTTVTAPVSGDENTVNVTVSVTWTAATLCSADIKKALDGNDETGAVVIDVSGLGQDITSITIPAKTVSDIAAAVADEENPTDSLTVKLTDGAVTFDAAAVAAITEQAGGKDLRLNLDNIRATSLKAAQQTAIADMEVEAVYDAYMTAGGKRITDFKGGSATVTVTYVLKEGQVGRGVVVWYVADDGTMAIVPTVYDDETVRFTIEHFSNYVVAYDEALAAACPQDDTCPIAVFADTDPMAWYHDGVHCVLENGIMSGYGNGLFGPDDATSRAMLAQILWNLEGTPVAGYALNFSDVAEAQWYTEALRWAVSDGVMEGYGGAESGTFGPNDPVTREQVAVILYRYAQKKGVDMSIEENTNILSYGDAFDVSEWAMSAMQWACGAGIIEGKEDGSWLAPQGATTRAELATMLMRFCKREID